MSDKHSTDERIDAALNALRVAEPRSGMEQRILGALRSAEQQAPTPPIYWMRWRAVSFAAGLMLVVAAAVIWYARQEAPHIARERTQSASLIPGATNQLHRSEVEEGSVSVNRASASIAKGTAPVRTRHVTPTAGSVEHMQMAATVHATEQSFPAPSLPLTEQERLLLRLVRRNSPVQLAQLTASARDATLQHEQEEVTSFFADPPPLVQEQQ